MLQDSQNCSHATAGILPNVCCQMFGASRTVQGLNKNVEDVLSLPMPQCPFFWKSVELTWPKVEPFLFVHSPLKPSSSRSWPLSCSVRKHLLIVFARVEKHPRNASKLTTSASAPQLKCEKEHRRCVCGRSACMWLKTLEQEKGWHRSTDPYFLLCCASAARAKQKSF